MRSLLLIFFLFMLVLVSRPATAQVIKSNQRMRSALVVKDSISSDSLLNFAREFLGCKYKYAQSSCEKGFDCSGFVSHCFKRFGIKLPRSATDYEFIGIEIPKDSCKAGDILVIKGTNAKSKRAGHVGIVTEHKGDDFYFIHSSSNKSRGGVIVSSFKSSPYYEKRFIKIIRITNCY